MNQTENKSKWSQIILFLKSRIFRYTLLRLAILAALFWILNSFFLNFYTNHGQKLSLAKYEGINIIKAKKHAAAKGYEIIVNDSIHILGKPGGIVISQIPLAKSMVKRGRKIYVTISRYVADIVLSDHLPDLYGKKLEHKIPELQNSFELKTKVIGSEYDSGPEGHILKVYYKNQLIVDAKTNLKNIQLFKGDTLSFIVSNKSGGEVDIPNLKCKTLDEVKFLLNTSELELGDIEEIEGITDPNQAYIISQDPPANTKARIGSKVQVKIQQTKPEECN